MRALERAFEALKDDDELGELILYCARRGSSHLAEFVWQLIRISSWLVDFAERLVRACVVWEDNFAPHNSQSSGTPHKDKDNIEVEDVDLVDDTLCGFPHSPRFAQLADPVAAATDTSAHIANTTASPYALDNLIGAL